MNFHFLHIRKTGGTAIKESLKNAFELAHCTIKLHGHKTRLSDIPVGDKVFFFLRDPVSRFVSGFNSRLRQGQPRYNSPWNEAEKRAFNIFPTANSLAEALTSERERASWAMENIRHVNSTYEFWLGSKDYVLKRKDDIVFIGFQESLDEDFKKLTNILHLPKNISLPKDSVRAHRTPKGFDTELSASVSRGQTPWPQSRN